MLSLNVQKVTKNYGKTVAVRDMSFVLQPGGLWYYWTEWRREKYAITNDYNEFNAI